MPATISAVEVFPLHATWERVYGSAEAVPPGLRHPAAHCQATPRRGQFATVVRIAAADGSHGWGEAWGLPAPGAAAAIIAESFRALLLGRDADDIGGAWDLLHGMLAGLGLDRGAHLEALSGIDLALWDRRGRVLDRPLAVLHGRGTGSGEAASVACYASPVTFQATPEDSATAARALVAQGFTALKLKVGREPAVDLDHLAAVRHAVGPAIGLRVDANGAWDAARASAFARGAQASDLAWIEEPVPAEDLAAAAAVRRATAIPIAQGENEFTLAGFARLLDSGAADVLTPNITRVGGLTGLLRVAELAARRHARLSLHGVGGALAVAASIHATAICAESMEANRLPNPLRDTLTGWAFQPCAGRLEVPTGPGIGITPLAGELARWRP